MNNLANIVKLTTIIIFWWIGIELYGLTFIMFTFLLYAVFAFVDAAYGVFLARNHWVTSSKNMWMGIFIKSTMWIIMIFTSVGVAIFNGVINHPWLEVWLSIFACLLNLWFAHSQIISIVENMWVHAHGRDKKWINTLLKWSGIWEKKLEEKIWRYVNTL